MTGKKPFDIILSDIKTNQEFQVREQTDDDTVERYAEIYREQGATGLPPITVYFSGDYFVIDGHHRVEAARRVGLSTLLAVLIDYSGEKISVGDCVLEAVRANSERGLSMTRADRIKAAKKIIDYFPVMPLREVAKKVGLSKSTIGNLKKEGVQIGHSQEGGEMELSENGWVKKCGGCGRTITDKMWKDVENNPNIVGLEDDVTGGKDPKCVFCSPKCRNEWESKQLDKAGTKILKNAGLDKDGRGGNDGPAPDTVPEERSPFEPGGAVPAPPVTTDHKDTPKLLPCPWCGKIPEVSCVSGTYWIACSTGSCVVNPYTTSADRLDLLAKSWNTRKGENQ